MLLPAVANAQPAVVPALVHHPVSTKIAEAQRLFDEGLTLVYAFNRGEAQRRFRAAARDDPSLAIAWWGVALAAGPNLNVAMTAGDWRVVADAVARAKALIGNASPEEARLIGAIGLRYPSGAKEPDGKAYRDAMAEVHKDFPGDDDAATLWVESVMDVESWGWTESGKPIGNTATLTRTLEEVMARTPLHPGANHYYAHLNDYTGAAQRAVVQADRLSTFPIEPAASHLKHMSGHIYLDVGNFAGVLRENKIAVADDTAYAQTIGVAPGELDYFYHNLDFYAGGALLLDDVEEARRAATLQLQCGDEKGLLVYARLKQFADVLDAKPPGNRVPDWAGVQPWHYARGIAFAAQHDAAAAERELAALRSSRDHSDLAVRMLQARIEYLRGEKASAIRHLRKVIAKAAPQPPEVFAPWYYPAGEWLGWMLLRDGDAAAAEAAFRADLVRTPHNARSLHGLIEALNAQGKSSETGPLKDDLAANWRGPQSDLEPSL